MDNEIKNNECQNLIQEKDFFHDAIIESITLEKNEFMTSDISIVLLHENNKYKISLSNVFEFSLSLQKNYEFPLIYEIRFKINKDNTFYLSLNPMSSDPSGDISQDANYMYCKEIYIVKF